MTLSKQRYNLYIQTIPWNTRKKEYINSLRTSLCELCKINRGEDVHHQNYDSLDYDNPGSELDEHLIYVCKECHEYIHTLATGKHSTKQEDMDKGLILLEKINIEKRVKFEEKRKREEEEYRIKQEKERIKQEKERIKNEEYRKKKTEEDVIEKRRLEEERRKKEKEGNRNATIGIIIFGLLIGLLIPAIPIIILGVYLYIWFFED